MSFFIKSPQIFYQISTSYGVHIRICGESFTKQKTIIVPDVHACAHHIACDSETNSEIVVPLLNNKSEIIGVLDVDSYRFGAFDKEDRESLEAIVKILQAVLS